MMERNISDISDISANNSLTTSLQEMFSRLEIGNTQSSHTATTISLLHNFSTAHLVPSRISVQPTIPSGSTTTSLSSADLVLKSEFEELLRSGSTFSSLPQDYSTKFHKMWSDEQRPGLTFKEKLKELFPGIKIFNTQALQRFASMTSSSLPKTTNQAPFPPRSSSQGMNAPSTAVSPSILKFEADLKAELEEVIRTTRPNISNLPLHYSNRFKKKLSAQHPEVKLKEKLRQLFPGIQFAGEKILLPSLGPPPRNKISTSTNLPPSKIPSLAPVVHSSVSSQRLPPPAPHQHQAPSSSSEQLKTAKSEAPKKTSDATEQKEKIIRTIAGSQTQITLSDLEKESGEMKKAFESEQQQGQGGQIGDPESAYWRFYSSHTVKKSEWFSSQSLLLGETAYKKLLLHPPIDVGLLGSIRRDDDEGDGGDHHLYLNMMHPFCAVCVGVQGAGKSHTMNVLLENCFIRCPYPTALPIVSLQRPMCGLVFHYDQSESNVCEAAGLRKVREWYDAQGVEKVVVLVSPSFYEQRKRFYGDQCRVVPLLFNWSTLGAQQLKKLMRLSENDSQLYVSVMLNFLRDFQRKELIPVFEDFMAQVEDLCNVNGQSKPLLQRLALLESIIYESEQNVNLRQYHRDLQSILECGTLVVADLTDPMLSADEANGIFQVLLEQFRKKRLDCGKVLACDEAHKYLTGAGNGREELAAAIVDVVRLMRHDGIRVLISTQSPLALPPELLELVSVTILHSFQSKDWYAYLSSKIHLPEGLFAQIRGLYPGQALVVATKTDVVAPKEDECNDDHCLALQIRPRLTTDLGSSRLHK